MSTQEQRVRRLNERRGKSFLGTGVIGSLSERNTQRDKDLRALERMKELEVERLAQIEHIQLCPRSHAQLYMTPGSDYGTRLIKQNQTQ